jgi:hypothetical protein
VIDYKTSKRPPTVPDAKRSIQLAFYTSAVAEETGEEVVGAEMWFPRADAKSIIKRSLDLDTLGEVMQQMETVSAGVVAEVWEPRVNEYCHRCDFRLSCPAWTEGKGAYLP